MTSHQGEVPSVTAEMMVATRISVHGLAEHVLAATERRATGSIRLYLRDGHLSTPDLPGTPARLELHAATIVRHPDGLAVPFHGRLGDLAERLGVEFGLPNPPYTPASGCGPDHFAEPDPQALALLTAAWRIGDGALRKLDSQTPVIWPEHLDIGITVNEVNYGVSPGDAFLPWPYAYVGPHELRRGAFWNAPFGAVRAMSELEGEDGTFAFFAEGRTQAAVPPPAQR
jgi:hypothetical protein